MRGAAVHEAPTPHLDAFMAKATWTTSARTVFPSSSYQAWGSMFHGVGPEKHQCGDEPFKDDAPWPSFMKVARQQHQEWGMGSFCSWGPINEHIIEDSLGCVKVSGPDLEVAVKSAAFIRAKRPQLFFLHLDNLDGAGHSYGYHSEEYRTCISLQDILLGRVLAAIDAIDPDGHSLVIVLSDHGGFTFANDDVTWHGHGADNEDCMQIFWSCRGPGVPGGTPLTAPVNIMDTAAVVAHFMGLPRPEGWDGKLPDGLGHGYGQA